MSNLKQYNGRFCKYDFENVFIQYLEDAGWSYLAGVKDDSKEIYA